MKIYSLTTDPEYLLGDGDSQAICLIEDGLRKSFTGSYPEVTKPLRYEFHKRAKVTDVLNQGGITSNGFLINQKVKELFSSFNLMHHKYYPAEVSGKGPIEEYYWLKIMEDLSGEIDFEKTVFREVHVATVVGEIKLRSLAHYQELRAEKGWRFTVNSKEIVLKSDSRLKQMDMFFFAPLDYATCISERLKNAIEEHGITGFQIEEYNDIKFDI